MKTRTLVAFVPRVLKSERFSLRGAAALAALAGALTLASCIPQDPPSGPAPGPGAAPQSPPPAPGPVTPGGSPPPVAPPPAAPPALPPPPGAPPVVAPPPGQPPVVAPPPGQLPTNITVTLIVGDEDELSAGDEELSDLLEDLGFDVDELDDGEDADEIEDDTGLIIIAGSASAGQVSDNFSNTRLPVLVMNDGVLFDMGMTADGREASGQENAEEVRISLANHPIASGVTGTVEVVDDRAQLQWGVPSSSAKVIAELAEDPGLAAIFAYDRGDQMVGQAAPDRRVFFFASDEASEDLSNDGEQLFENAVLWAWSGQIAVRPD
jgi:hypothetical protein